MIRRLYTLLPRPGLLLRLGALQAALAVLQGLLLGVLVPVLDALLRPEPDFGAAGPWLVIGGLGTVLYGVLAVLATPVGFAASMELGARLRHHLIRHVTTLPLGWFTARNRARLARAVTSDAGAIGQLAVTTGGPAITATLVPATVIAITFAVDPTTALLFLAVVPFAWPAIRRAGRVNAEVETELEEAAAGIAGRAVEFGQAQPVLRAAGQGGTGTARMRDALLAHRRVYRRGLRRALVPDLTFTAVVMAGFVAVLIVTALRLTSGELAVAEAVALLVLAVRFLEPLATLVELIGALRAMDNAVGRVRALLSVPPLPVPPDPVTAVGVPEVAFASVGYAYGGPGSAPALDGVSFTCPPGSSTALVGPSGAGKSTVVRLIARFFDADTGSVRVGGRDVRDHDPAALLADIAVVLQDVYLFDDTVEENLRIARPDATRAELLAAADAARLTEVVARLPDGWDTRVGEGGARLSGGERQRVSIARALLKRSRIVLVDEAASALDPENERAVADAIAALARDPERTVLVIAHAPATLAACDRVLVLDAGRVVEAGTPDELRAAGGFFARLDARQREARAWRLAARARQP
ncbi:ABC transporter ATP-binding protein [Streptomyces marincola]|uniref:ABC transporter n=1 Tax=Streptomyces marincola TaxID=2878388 RepID=A0A1W7CS41_9ACTN|nr:ABC transporter ATP-binding protein [Streptomyces marincola]ARQ67567.1 ABC transporter [Streptomyces marincola]